MRFERGPLKDAGLVLSQEIHSSGASSGVSFHYYYFVAIYKFFGLFIFCSALGTRI